MSRHEELTSLAAACLQKGDLNAAEAGAEAALAMSPLHQPAWVVMAIALAKKNKHERAVAAFERALQLDPNDVASHTSLAELCIELGAYSRASSALRSAMELDGKAAHPSGRRARALVAKTLSVLKTK